MQNEEQTIHLIPPFDFRTSVPTDAPARLICPTSNRRAGSG